MKKSIFPPIDAEELEERSEKERTSYMYKKLSDKEHTWSQEAMKRCLNSSGKISGKTIASLNLCEEVKQKFNKKISVAGLYSRFNNMNPQYKHKRRKGNAIEISNYLVFVKPTGQTAGFETEDEVKTFIETNQILGNSNIRIFKYMPTTVKYEINIGK